MSKTIVYKIPVPSAKKFDKKKRIMAWLFNNILLDKMMLKDYNKKIFLTNIYPIGYAMLYKTRVHIRKKQSPNF